MTRRVPPGQTPLVPPPLQQAANSPPYPTTTTAESAPGHSIPPYPPDNPHTDPAASHHPEDDLSEPEDSNSDWDTGDEDENATPDDTGGPSTGQPGTQADGSHDGLPAALRVGPPAGLPKKSSDSLLVSQQEQQRAEELRPQDTGRKLSSNNPYNPYIRMQNTGQSNFGTESSAAIWGDSAREPAELPSDQGLSSHFSGLKVLDEPGAEPLSPTRQPPPPPVQSQEHTEVPARHESNASSAWTPGMDISSLDAALTTEGPASSHTEDVWQQLDQAFGSSQEPKTIDSPTEAPTRPPRSQGELPPQQPPRPAVSTAQASTPSRADAETPTTIATRQRKENYQIKQVNWKDAGGNMRRSPILIQNANGPCPLLALVNALVLSTPQGQETALVENLRTREQISLGLLLDAVFDELTSGRRGGAEDLPDVGDLYAFLINLHTGMNVNPRFVPLPVETGPVVSGDYGEMDNIHPAIRHKARPGDFEMTREMQLYGTFYVPLVHGWLAPPASRPWEAFERAAQSYEDAQNIQFREEELEAKLQSTGLASDEQTMFEDVQAIKNFLARWPTQLTDYGLQVMSKHLKPGQIAILFRNDHFSTLYKEPRSGQIMTLVTDAGYSTHEEIVWESLVDVNGSGSELYSGDFRPVSHNQDGPSSATPAGPRQGNGRQYQSMLDVGDEDGWTTVSNGRRQRQPQQRLQTGSSTTSSANPYALPQETGVVGASSAKHFESAPTSPQQVEQEDHDLALALQLQEEEEERHRHEQAERRRHEDQLSQQFLERETSNPLNSRTSNPNHNNRHARATSSPAIPPRRSGNVAVNVPQTEDEAPPPTYEQAARRPAYIPPEGHPSSPSAPIGSQGQRQQHQRATSAYTSNSGRTGAAPQQGRRGSRLGQEPLINRIPANSAVGAAGRKDEGEKCVVM